MKFIILKIEYDGTDYSGWQLQHNAKTVQGEIEKGLYKLTGRKLSIVGSGRTDSGVHASNQIAHLQIDDIPVPENKFSKALNTYLPKDIRIKKTVFTCQDFHSRFDAVERGYNYILRTRYSVFHRRFEAFIKYGLDIEKLFKSADIFKGKHDFTSFSKYNPEQKNHICNIFETKWEQKSENSFIYTVKADHFLYGMVRSLVGAMIDAARGKRTFENIKQALEKRDRVLNSPLAPPEGLVLSNVIYKNKII